MAEKARRQRVMDAERRMFKHSLDEKGNEDQVSIATGNGTTKGKGGKADMEGKEKVAEDTAKEQGKVETKTSKKKLSARSNRSSKRVLSKRITSGKNAERSAKRKSAEYCLVSAVFSCTSQHPVYSECLKKDAWWKESQTNNDLTAGTDLDSPTKKVGGAGNTTFPAPRDNSSLIGDLDSSLESFLLGWSRENSGANDVLIRFLLHVSWYIDDVFSSEAGGTVALSSCILECKSTLCHDVWVQYPVFLLKHRTHYLFSWFISLLADIQASSSLRIDAGTKPQSLHPGLVRKILLLLILCEKLLKLSPST